MGPDLSVLKFRVFWEADYSSAFQSQVCNTAYSLRWLRWVIAYKYFTDTWVNCAQGAVNEKTLLTCWKYLWSQSTYEPSSTHNHHHPDWEASTYCFIPDPSHQVWRCTRHEAFPTPHLTTQISACFSFLCFKYNSEKEARPAVKTQEPYSYLAPSVSGISPAEWSQRKPTAKTIWLLLCGNTSKTPGNLCFLQAAPVHTGGFLRGH